jgi:tripartite-type tricarboxylate transporter receptor subunit TctC
MQCGRIVAFLLIAVLAAASPGRAPAQSAVDRPVKVIVPLPAGSTSDVVARLIADRLRDDAGQVVVVENRPGASGRIAVDALKTAPADGATLLLAPIAVPVIGPLVFRDLSYDPAKDFAPIAQVAKYEFAFAVAADHPARTIDEFVAWARANPARASFGTAGPGGLPHFVGEMVGQTAGVELVHVGYKGIAPALTDLMSGRIAAGIGAVADLIGLHRTGKLRVLATSGEKRAPLLPEVPTFGEQGYRSIVANGWHGVYAPAGTPQPVIDRLSGMIVAALQTPELIERFAALGLEPTGTTPQELAAIMVADTARWRSIIKASGFTVE